MMRSVIALDPRLFGRGRTFLREVIVARSTPALIADLKLFGTTFLGGFLFIAIYLS